MVCEDSLGFFDKMGKWVRDLADGLQNHLGRFDSAFALCLFQVKHHEFFSFLVKD